MFSDDIFLAEVHELSELSVFDVVIDSFSALDLGVQGEFISDLVFSLVFVDDSPDALSGGASILFQDSFSIGESFRESFFETGDVIVGIGVAGDKDCLREFNQG